MRCPKVLAIYLPQYHRTLHNDAWWGEGFTDWETVKRAESLFPQHKQPHVPLGRNYYNLLDKTAMIFQAQLAKKYGIDGFIFYHYYFGNGRMELEKPAENLLRWTDLDMPFCFSWANQSWIRTWSKFAGNVWGEKLETAEHKSNDSGMLTEQIYGDETEWKKHFEYLLPFFRDNRYIRIEGRPVFIIYNPSDMVSIARMMDLWRNLALKNGLPGLYLIGYNTYVNDKGFDALMLAEPSFSIRKINKRKELMILNGVRCIDYKDFWENNIATAPPHYTKTFFTVACGYDTTPRRGSNGECIINRSPELFKHYLIQALQKTLYYDNEFLAINAWNEWGEGMYLEPDEEDGYRYLEAVKESKEAVEKMGPDDIAKILNVMQSYGDRDDEQGFLLAKFQYYYKICSKWIDLLNTEKNPFKSRLGKWGIGSVAIYGFADIGHKLLDQLRKEGIAVNYAIDQYVGSVNGDIKVYRPEEDLPEVDAIIITAYDPNDIRKQLQKKSGCKIVDIRELLDE